MTAIAALQSNFDFVARDQRALAAVQSLLVRWGESLGIRGEFRELAGQDVYFKGEPLAAWPRMRHGTRRLLLRRPYPRLAEFANLEWLAGQGFLVPRPLVAGIRRTWNGVDWQFLVTERVHAAQMLVEDGNAPSEAVLQELARDVARLHNLGFVHRDLHLRNLAWLEGVNGPRILIFDAWRGGARLQTRGISYDVGCLLEGLASDVDEALAAHFEELYLRERFPASPRRQQRLRRAAGRQRERLGRKRAHQPT